MCTLILQREGETGVPEEKPSKPRRDELQKLSNGNAIPDFALGERHNTLLASPVFATQGLVLIVFYDKLSWFMSDYPKKIS